MNDKKQRGGKREGAGRPAEVPCRKMCVYLDEQTIDRLRRLGAGNLSAGIRAAADVVGVFDKPANAEIRGGAAVPLD